MSVQSRTGGMSGKRWRKLKDQGPVDIVARPMAPSARRSRKEQPHARRGRTTLFQTTKPHPAARKVRRRVRTAMAKASRRANR